MTNNDPADLSPKSSPDPHPSDFSVQLPESSALLLATYTPQILPKLLSILSPQWPYCKESHPTAMSQFSSNLTSLVFTPAPSILSETLFSWISWEFTLLIFLLSLQPLLLNFLYESVCSLLLEMLLCLRCMTNLPLTSTLFLHDLSTPLDPVTILKLFSSLFLTFLSKYLSNGYFILSVSKQIKPKTYFFWTCSSLCFLFSDEHHQWHRCPSQKSRLCLQSSLIFSHSNHHAILPTSIS